jgi:peptidoglycan/xylan/chitin deacetylase (PgdA/CDA1 family)
MKIKKVIKKIKYRANSRIPKAVVSFDVSRPMLALTFDDGPSLATSKLLDLLSEYNAEATFFVTGKSVAEHPHILREALKRGHAVGNHTESHKSMTTLSLSSQIQEIRKCSSSIPPTKFFRPPYGAQNATSYCVTRSLGLLPIGWSRSGKDWGCDDAQSLYNRISIGLQAGDIMLLHDGLQSYNKKCAVDRTATIEAVKRLLSRYSSKFEFVNLQRMAEHGRPVWKNWFVMHD